jgi:hypothetical protein
LFDILTAGRSKRTAKVGTAIEIYNPVCERFGVLRFNENTTTDYFRNCRGADGDNRLAGGHCFEEHDSETFLETG